MQYNFYKIRDLLLFKYFGIENFNYILICMFRTIPVANKILGMKEN